MVEGVAAVVLVAVRGDPPQPLMTKLRHEAGRYVARMRPLLTDERPVARSSAVSSGKGNLGARCFNASSRRFISGRVIAGSKELRLSSA